MIWLRGSFRVVQRQFDGRPRPKVRGNSKKFKPRKDLHFKFSALKLLKILEKFIFLQKLPFIWVFERKVCQILKIIVSSHQLGYNNNISSILRNRKRFQKITQNFEKFLEIGHLHDFCLQRVFTRFSGSKRRKAAPKAPFRRFERFLQKICFLQMK